MKIKYSSSFYSYLFVYILLKEYLILSCKATFTVLETNFKLYYDEVDQKIGLSNSYRSFALFNVDIGIQHNFKKAEVMNYITGFLNENKNTTKEKEKISERCAVYYSITNENENGDKTKVIKRINQSITYSSISNTTITLIKPFVFLNYTDILEHQCDINDVLFANHWNKNHSSDKLEETTDEIFIYENNNNGNNSNNNNNNNVSSTNTDNNIIKKMNNIDTEINDNKDENNKKPDDIPTQEEETQIIIEPSMIIISLPEKEFESMKTETDPNIIGLHYTKNIMNSKIPITFVKDDELLFLTINITTNQLWMQMTPAPTEATTFQYQNSTKAGYIIELVINIILFLYTLFINFTSMKFHFKITKKNYAKNSKDNKKLNIYILSLTLLSTSCFLLASIIKVRVIYKYIPFITSMTEYCIYTILMNMGYLSCYICGSLLLYKFIDAYTKNYIIIKDLTIWSSFIILPCSMIVKVVFDLLNQWWCSVIKTIAFYIVLAILFAQCIAISIFGKKIYNVFSKSQMAIRTNPFHPKSSKSMEHLKKRRSYHKPKDRVSILTISGCLLFIAQLISLIIFSVLTESGSCFWIILFTRMLLTDGCVYLIVFLFKKESTQRQEIGMMTSPYDSSSSSISINSSFTLASSNKTMFNESPLTPYTSPPMLEEDTHVSPLYRQNFINNRTYQYKNIRNSMKTALIQDAKTSDQINNDTTTMNDTKRLSSKGGNNKNKINDNYQALIQNIEESLNNLEENIERASTIKVNLDRNATITKKNIKPYQREKSVIDIFNDSENPLSNIFKLELAVKPKSAMSRPQSFYSSTTTSKSDKYPYSVTNKNDSC